MREQGGAVLDYYVAAGSTREGGDGSDHQGSDHQLNGEGTLGKPFSSLDRALSGIAQRHAGERPTVRPVVGYDQIEIAAVDSPGIAPASNRARYEFYID